VLRFDAEGQLIPSEEQAEGFASRTGLSNLDEAMFCCFERGGGSYPYRCTVSKGTCVDTNQCFSPYFTPDKGFGNGVMDCRMVGYGL